MKMTPTRVLYISVLLLLPFLVDCTGATLKEHDHPHTHDIPLEEPITEPVEEPITEPVEEPITEPVEEPITEPVEEPITEPVEEPITEPVEEPITEPVEPASCPVFNGPRPPDWTTTPQKVGDVCGCECTGNSCSDMFVILVNDKLICS